MSIFVSLISRILNEFDKANLVGIQLVRQVQIVVSYPRSVIEPMDLWNNVHSGVVECLAQLAPYLSLIVLMGNLDSDKLLKDLC